MQNWQLLSASSAALKNGKPPSEPPCNQLKTLKFTHANLRFDQLVI